MKLGPRTRKFTGGWIGGLLLFVATVYTGVLVSKKMPVDTDYDLALDFMTQRKLEYYAKSENEFSSPLMDVSELSAKVTLGKQIIPIKISSIPEPFSDVGHNLLSFFITNEDDANPYLLLSPTKYATTYVTVTSRLSEDIIPKIPKTHIINLKTNGLNPHPYYKISLPSNDDFESQSLADALRDKDFKDIKSKWTKIISESDIPNKDKWLADVIVYYIKNDDGSIILSHFLPLGLREFYE